MRNLAFGALFVGLLAACGGGSSGGGKKTVMIVDSPNGSGTDGGDVCNVLTQAGCMSGEKCTWIIDTADTSGSTGHIGCAPDGTKADGAACTRMAPGATGYDDCAKGNYCFGPDMGGAGVCKAICDQAGGAPMCATGFACTTYDGLFGPSGMPVAAGVCDPTCDPLADNNFKGSAADTRTGTACGSALATSGGSAIGSGLYKYGCYGYPDGRFGVTKFTCTGQLNFSRFHRTACDTTKHTGDLAACAPNANSVYVNGCAAGYEPIFIDAEGSTQTDCVAMCAPAVCYAGTGHCGSGTAGNLHGDNTANHGCYAANMNYNGTFNNTSNGEQCFYSWNLEFDGSGALVKSPTSDTVGFCFDHSKYLYDPAGGSNATTTVPACNMMNVGSAAGASDASFWGCVDTATATAAGDLMFNGKLAAPRPIDLRAPYHHANLKAF